MQKSDHGWQESAKAEGVEEGSRRCTRRGAGHMGIWVHRLSLCWNLQVFYK
jgi:hypothetical protein